MIRIVFKQLVALSFALSFVVTAVRAAPALAPPANDSLSGAKVVTVGFSELFDTSEATTDADDEIVNSGCGFPATDASVWYQFVGTGEKVRLSVFQSGYSASVIAISPNLINPSLFACGQGLVDFVALAGQTYYILAFDDQRDGAGNGGLLNISLSLAPPPPDLTVRLSVESFESVNARTGVVTMAGTYSCVNADSLILYVDLAQVLGRRVRDDGEIVLRAWGDASVQFQGNCDGNLHPWSADVYPLQDPDLRKFVGGQATTDVIAYSEGPHGFSDFAVISREIILRSK